MNAAAHAVTKQVTPLGELEYRGVCHRLLEVKSNCHATYEKLIEAAVRKGWIEYQRGTDPTTDELSCWMLKPSSPS